MKTFISIVVLAIVAFMNGCSMHVTVENQENGSENGSGTSPTEKDSSHKDGGAPSAQTEPASNETQQDTRRADAGGADADASREVGPPDAGVSASGATARLDSGVPESSAPDSSAPESPSDSGPPDSGVRDSNVPDSGPPDMGNAASWDPHVFATPELGVLVRVDSDTVVRPAERPFWADDALAVSAFERENGRQYSVLVYERRPDESFRNWLMRSKVGGVVMSQNVVWIRNGRRAYLYAADDYGAVPNVHIIVPSERFVYYFRSEEETFEVPDDFLDFIREIEVQ